MTGGSPGGDVEDGDDSGAEGGAAGAMAFASAEAGLCPIFRASAIRSFLLKYDTITSRAIGAANCPCSPQFSHSTAITISGL
jgi:hypothetical protein